MPSTEWQASTAHRQSVVLDPADLAWEFLRRNPDYQASFMTESSGIDRKAIAQRWGLRFLADPRHGAEEVAVFWDPEELTSVVILAPRRKWRGPGSFVIDDWFMTLPRRRAEDGTHVLLRDGRVRYQILLTTPPKRGVVRVAVLPLDNTTPYRGQATRAFWDYAARGHPRPRFTGASRLERLNTALRALDLRLGGASYRSIAEALFGQVPRDAPPWKTASLRDTVVRLVRTGLFMMRGGYRGLLGPTKSESVLSDPPP